MKPIRRRLLLGGTLGLVLAVAALVGPPQAGGDYLFERTPTTSWSSLSGRGPTSDAQRSGTRVDFFDPQGKRTGWAEYNRFCDGKLDFYDARGPRTGTAEITPGGTRSNGGRQ
jgi:hypothetical protein